MWIYYFLQTHDKDDCVCIYTPTGKREDLWESLVKRPKVFKCLGAYMSIS